MCGKNRIDEADIVVDDGVRCTGDVQIVAKELDRIDHIQKLNEGTGVAKEDVEWIGALALEFSRPKEGIRLISKAMRLNPYYPANYLFVLGQAYFMMGQNQKAIATLERARNRNPEGSR